ncbi:PAS domain-containing sensor histidine kinase [Cytophaga aurantiaca]|uniref:PAS domain-containing sensor histidine kinase n=1 Tax=Cytophaga aurantiaca TaxID=29530 RepID=UPI00036E95C9|nr:PAS domain-containing sensor histidine kinase [Cytophaga aurantiaca]
MSNSEETLFKMDSFFELSMDLLCIAGFDGFFKKINPSVSRILEYTDDELYSRPINEFVHPDDRHITSMYRDKIYENIPLLNFENRYITKSGSIVWFTWTSMPSIEDRLVYAIAKNITHKKIAEEARNKMVSSLTEVNNNFKQLTYTISHDLRSPINNLLTIFDFIDSTKINDIKTLESIEMLRLASENLKTTVDNYAEILNNKEKYQTNLTVLNLKHTLHAVLTSIHTLIVDSNTKFEINFSQLESITFNKVYLESIFLNLITNAIKYSKPNCSPIVKISSRIHQGVSQLIISDNGLGLNLSDVKDEIFTLHTKFHEHADSSGIGLYLVYSHINNMGGKIDIESEPNKGTTFIISFKK